MALINCPECNKQISDKAVSCPSCGAPLEDSLSYEINDHGSKSNINSCPSCKSDNTQSIKMMCLNGTTSGTSTGIGVSSDLSIGVGGLKTNSQTALAERFMPKRGFTETGGMIVGGSLVFLIIGFGLDNDLGKVIFSCSIFFVCIGALAVIVGLIPNKVRDKNNKLYEEGWLCHKCGNTWLPIYYKSYSDHYDNASNKNPNLINNLSKYNISKRKRYIVICIIFSLLVLVMIKKCFFDLSETEMDAMIGLNKIGKHAYIKTDSIKITSTGTYVVYYISTNTSNKLNSKGESYAYSLDELVEVNCKDLMYKSLGGVAEVSGEDGKSISSPSDSKPASTEWAKADKANKNMSTIVNKVCGIVSNKPSYHFKLYIDPTAVYNNKTSVYKNITSNKANINNR